MTPELYKEFCRIKEVTAIEQINTEFPEKNNKWSTEKYYFAKLLRIEKDINYAYLVFDNNIYSKNNTLVNEDNFLIPFKACDNVKVREKEIYIPVINSEDFDEGKYYYSNVIVFEHEYIN